MKSPRCVSQYFLRRSSPVFGPPCRHRWRGVDPPWLLLKNCAGELGVIAGFFAPCLIWHFLKNCAGKLYGIFVDHLFAPWLGLRLEKGEEDESNQRRD